MKKLTGWPAIEICPGCSGVMYFIEELVKPFSNKYEQSIAKYVCKTCGREFKYNMYRRK